MGLEFQDFKKKLFHKRIHYSKSPFTCDFHLSITISTWDTSLGPFSSQFSVDDVTRLSQNFKILRALFHKGITHLKSTFHFWFSSIYQHWYMNTNLDLSESFLDWWPHNRVLKLPNFEIVVPKGIVYLNLFLSLTFIVLLQLVHGIQAWTHFDLNLC